MSLQRMAATRAVGTPRGSSFENGPKRWTFPVEHGDVSINMLLFQKEHHLYLEPLDPCCWVERTFLLEGWNNSKVEETWATGWVYVDYTHTHHLGELQGTARISPFQEEKGLAHIILHTPYKSVSMYKDKDLFIPNQRCVLVLAISSETPTNKFFRILHFEFIACMKHQNGFLGIFQFEARILEFLPTWPMISWTRQHVPCIDDSYS